MTDTAPETWSVAGRTFTSRLICVGELVGKLAEAGHGEHRLRENRPAEKLAEAQRAKRHDRDQRVAERVTQDHDRLGQALMAARREKRFAAAKQQFETALTIVRAELDGQKAVIQSALS